MALTVTIERLAFGGDGLGRMPDGRVVFVPGALPGDVVEVELTQERKGFCRAAVKTRIKDAPERITPDCSLSETCGGCQLWPLDYNTSWTLKRGAALDALRRAGRFKEGDLPDLTAIAAPSDRRYRRRLRMRIDGAGRTGFYEAGTHTLVPVQDCLVAHPTLLAARDALAPMLAGLGGGSALFELDKDGQRAVAELSVERVKAARTRLAAHFEASDTPPALMGVRLLDRGRRLDFGRIHFDMKVDGTTRRLEVGAFAQANDAINDKLVEEVIKALDPREGDAILELYCGAGNFSMGLASRGADVQGLEIDPRAIATARRTAKALGLPPSRTRFDVQNLNKGFFHHWATPGQWQKVLLDPPRTGAKTAIKDIVRAKPEIVVYVSCDPPTLGRDLKVLMDGGYAVTRLVALDMFPRTYHTEMIAVTTR